MNYISECVFCPNTRLLELIEVWCPNCKTHYVTRADTKFGTYTDSYDFQNKPDPNHPNLICRAVFIPKNLPLNPKDLFQIRLFHNNHDTYKSHWQVLVELDYLPDYITPFNFTEKLKTYLTFS